MNLLGSWARLPRATVATMSADRYADQTRILIQFLAMVLRWEPNTMRMVCSKRLSKTIPRISQLFHKFKTSSGNCLSIVCFPQQWKLVSLDEPWKWISLKKIWKRIVKSLHGQLLQTIVTYTSKNWVLGLNTKEWRDAKQ
jgi:hypothetical protein